MATKIPKPPAKEAAAIEKRARAAGFKPTAAAVAATYARNQARQTAAAGAQSLAAPKGEIGRALPPPPGGGGDAVNGDANAYWNDFLARLKAGESPAAIEASNVQKFGGRIDPGQGPEQNLSGAAYAGQILQQYAGSPTLGNIDVQKSYSPKAWLAYLKKIGVKGYQGVNSGAPNPDEYRRALESGGVNAGLKGGRYGFGYDNNGRRLSIEELIAAVTQGGVK